jgi:hypothetical protein
MKQLLTQSLFEQVLLDPAESGASELFIVTGYASPTIVTKHLEDLKNRFSSSFSVDVLVGMTGEEGLPQNTALGFRSIPRQSSGSKFSCAYTLPGKSIHSKVYVWCNSDGPHKAWVGSANYTAQGFGIFGHSLKRSEVLTEVEPVEAFEYFLESATNSIDYLHPDLSKYLVITEDTKPDKTFHDALPAGSFNSVALPLVQTTKQPGEVHNAGAGLNWGQRKGRDPDQSYIPIPSTIGRSGFFPARGVHFQVITDDGESFIAVRAQDGGKAIETPSDNSILGKYFRRKLGLPRGSLITTEDLNRFGSKEVIFTKMDDELFGMVFANVPTP